MTTQTPTDILINFLARLIDGEHIPVDSKPALEVEAAVRAMLATRDFETLGLHTLSLIIDRVRSDITATQALRDFIQPGGRA